MFGWLILTRSHMGRAQQNSAVAWPSGPVINRSRRTGPLPCHCFPLEPCLVQPVWFVCLFVWFRGDVVWCLLLSISGHVTYCVSHNHDDGETGSWKLYLPVVFRMRDSPWGPKSPIRVHWGWCCYHFRKWEETTMLHELLTTFTYCTAMELCLPVGPHHRYKSGHPHPLSWLPGVDP